MTEFGLKTAWLDGKLQASTAIHQINQKNTLYPAPTADNADLMEQIGKERSKGIEFDIQGQILPHWSVIASYAYNDAKITEGGNNEELNRQTKCASKYGKHLDQILHSFRKSKRLGNRRRGQLCG